MSSSYPDFSVVTSLFISSFLIQVCFLDGLSVVCVCVHVCLSVRPRHCGLTLTFWRQFPIFEPMVASLYFISSPFYSRNWRVCITGFLEFSLGWILRRLGSVWDWGGGVFCNRDAGWFPHRVGVAGVLPFRLWDVDVATFSFLINLRVGILQLESSVCGGFTVIHTSPSKVSTLEALRIVWNLHPSA